MTSITGAIDMDDTFFPFTVRFSDYGVKQGLEAYPIDEIKSTDFRDVFKCPRDLSHKLFNDLQEDQESWIKFHHLDEEYKQELDNIDQNLGRIKALGIELVVLTARDEINNFKVVTDFCQKYFPDKFSDFHFCNTYSQNAIRRTKAEVCKQYGINFLVDDSLHHIKDVTQNGINGILFSSNPWSQHPGNIPTWDKLSTHLTNLYGKR